MNYPTTKDLRLPKGKAAPSYAKMPTIRATKRNSTALLSERCTVIFLLEKGAVVPERLRGWAANLVRYACASSNLVHCDLRKIMLNFFPPLFLRVSTGARVRRPRILGSRPGGPSRVPSCAAGSGGHGGDTSFPGAWRVFGSPRPLARLPLSLLQ